MPTLQETPLATDRWPIWLVSPEELSAECAAERDLVIVHPGWAHNPRRHEDLLFELAEAGFLAIGVDTRYGYTDSGRELKRWDNSKLFSTLMDQDYRVGAHNPFFEVDEQAPNRWELRRPTTILNVCKWLGATTLSLFGHSDGARISAHVAQAAPGKVKNLVVANGAGTGNSDNALTRLALSNLDRIKEVSRGDIDATETVVGALESVFYTLTHLRRTYN